MKRNHLLGSILAACVCLLVAAANAPQASAQTGQGPVTCDRTPLPDGEFKQSLFATATPIER